LFKKVECNFIFNFQLIFRKRSDVYCKVFTKVPGEKKIGRKSEQITLGFSSDVPFIGKTNKYVFLRDFESHLELLMQRKGQQTYRQTDR
jgi:hypothetical protein